MKITARTDVGAYAWRKLDLMTKVDDKRVPMTVVLRTPFECDDEHWLCAVSLSGLTHRKRDFRGASSEESLSKAKAFALDELRRFTALGGVIESANAEPVVHLSSLFDE